MKGLIFTLVWAFDEKEDWDYVAEITEIFKAVGAEIYYVELEANLATRLERNIQPDRIAAKPSKTDVTHSEKVMLYHENKYRMNSREGEIQFENYLRIDNTNLSAAIVAEQIKTHFKL